MQSIDPNNSKTFWKKITKSVPGNMKIVYGASHPPIIESPNCSPEKEHKSHKKNLSLPDSFQDFQESVSDAWDCEDDEFSVISDLDIKISSKVSHSVALNVIDKHKTKNKFPVSQHAVETFKSFRTTPSKMPLQKSGVNRKIDAAKFSVLNRSNNIVAYSQHDREFDKEEKISELLHTNKTDLNELRKYSWSGIPAALRADVWKVLSGYLPANVERRHETLYRKRSEYWSFVNQYFQNRIDDVHHDTYRQIHIDIPRMSPLVPLFQQSIVQEIFERILYIWAIRHPASGYVQGMNDLVTPFFMVFLHSYVPKDRLTDTYDVGLISKQDRDMVEADSFWCMNKLMDGIQDNYTFAQPGIQEKVQKLAKLTERIDATLHNHLRRHEIDFLQFSFRWFNNLLMREIPLECTIRLWDTLHAEPDGFSHFVLYVCAAFLTHFSTLLMKQTDFQNLMLMLQNLPTKSWKDDEIRMIVAEAFRLKYVFADAPNHLITNNK